MDSPKLVKTSGRELLDQRVERSPFRVNTTNMAQQNNGFYAAQGGIGPEQVFGAQREKNTVTDMFEKIKPNFRRGGGKKINQRQAEGAGVITSEGLTGTIGCIEEMQMFERDKDDEGQVRQHNERRSGQFRGNRQNLMDESCFKKQMEMRGGKCHQLITDQEQNSNRIFANRYYYRNWVGLWYFLIDCVYHFENLLLMVVIAIVFYGRSLSTTSSSELSIPLYFPLSALIINFVLMATRNIIFEMRQLKVTQKVNNKTIELLNVTRSSSKFIPMTWEKIKPGQIIRIYRGEEFPADCLILDIQGQSGQTCYVTRGPFDDSISIVQKRSFTATSNKTGKVQTEQHFADMISGQLKLEYNYFGYIMGSFKLNENPQAHDFDHDNVVQRGTFLRNTPQAICLVLNVGNQCIGSIYKDPKKYMLTSTDQVLTSFVKTQRSFDKAYKQSIRVFLLSLTALFVVISFLVVYISDTLSFSNVNEFETHVMMADTAVWRFYIDKCLGCLLILLSSLPFSFSNMIHLLVLISTNFAEWDVDVIPANITFRHPHATLAFGKVAHMFLSRNALQMDEKQCVKLMWVGGRFYKNQFSVRAWDQMKVQQQREINQSFRESGDEDDEYEQLQDTDIHEHHKSEYGGDLMVGDQILDYFPNELKFSSKFTNDEVEDILESDDKSSSQFTIGGQTMKARKEEISEFLRSLTLCHQVQCQHDFGYRINQRKRNVKYVGIFNDEIATVEFARSQGFKLWQRKKKMITLEVNDKTEQYDELGVVTTKAVMDQFMTISAVRVKDSAIGILYMKGSLASLKHYFARKESDLHFLNEFQDRFIQSGQKAIVYAKRILTLDETNQLIITLNEGISSSKENGKINTLLRQLTNKECEILGILGIQKSIHLRNRVVIDDMVLNGVKPWIISEETEQSHLTSLNSIRLFQGCADPFMITGRTQKIVQEQIMNALRTVTERLEEYQHNDLKKKEEEREREKDLYKRKEALRLEGNKHSRFRQALNWLLGYKATDETEVEQWKAKTEKMREDRRRYIAKEKEMQTLQTEKSYQRSRNCVVFTGQAMTEIFRDHTLQKSFMTLAYLSDILIGSEVKPLLKQKIVLMARNYIGEGEYTACVITTPEDQFMINEADLCVNLKDRSKSTDFQAVVDVSIKDLSAISYLLFKHGNQIQQRLSKAVQAFFYKQFIILLMMITYLISSAFSAAIPFKDTYYLVFMLVLAPAQILVYAMFFKNYGNDCYYRIFGHYKYNFSFTLVELECIISDLCRVTFDWCIIYIPHQLLPYRNDILSDGRMVSIDAYQVHQVLLLEFIMFFYFGSSTQVVLYQYYCQMFFVILGCALVFDDQGLAGVTEFFDCPLLMFTLLWQILVLMLRNFIADVGQKQFIRHWADLLDWYTEVEERLAFEEFENINQIVSIHQYKPLYLKINSFNIERTLKLINKNMIRCTKSQELEQILEKINAELDYTRRGQVELSGTINMLTLKFNDLNKEAEYQENKNQREITYVGKQMIVFAITTMLFAIVGLILYFSNDFTNVGVFYYFILSFFTIIMHLSMPYLKHHLSKVLLGYTVVVIAAYSVYTSQSESLQPCGLIFVLALVAGLNHSFVYMTMLMIIISVLAYIFFSLVAQANTDNLSEENLQQTQQLKTISGFRSVMWVLTGLVWSIYVYFQELEKKIQFTRGHVKVRNLIKLKKILNILVPSLVRDKIAAGKKNFADEEGEATIIFIDIHNFDVITSQYSPKELVVLLDQVYNQFDTYCDQYGIQKIESVGKRYMACGGLKSADKRIESIFLNKHHSVRVTDFALEILNYTKQVFLKSGQHLEVRVGIHTGFVVSVVVGDMKPQFSLIGSTVNRTSFICRNSPASKVTISAQAQHYLLLYTNNLSFQQLKNSNQHGVQIHLKPQDKMYLVSKARGQRISNFHENQMLGTPTLPQTSAMMPIGKLIKDPLRLVGTQEHEAFQSKSYSTSDKKEKEAPESDNESAQRDLSVGEASGASNNSEALAINIGKTQAEHQNLYREQLDNESQKSDRDEDDDKMNVFGFNDDLGPQLDDRIIIANPTENAKYNVVERPKNLMMFEARDSENEFLYKISKQEAKKTTIILVALLILNKLIIVGDMIEHERFTVTPQFIAMFPITIVEIALIYSLNNPTRERVVFWTTILMLYGTGVLVLLISLEFRYLGNWQRAGFNELLFELTLSLFFMMRNIFLRHFVICYGIYLMFMVALAIYYRKAANAYQSAQILLGQMMYFILLCIGIHHREMIQRKVLNYERILNVEIKKTNDLISNLIPYHLLNVIINEKRQVDYFENMTLLYVDIPGFVNFHKDVVRLLSRLFTRFDQLTIENKVYKVQTIGDCYIVMGYSGRVEQSARTQAIQIDEANRVVHTGLQMLDCIGEVKKTMRMLENDNLNVRVGIHTGQIVAGIIGTKLVKYDIFGENVLTAYKVKSNTPRGQVNVTKETLALLGQAPKVLRNYVTEPSASFFLPTINRQVQTYSIQWRDTSDGEDEMASGASRDNDDYGSLTESEDSEEGEGHSAQKESEYDSESEEDYGIYMKRDRNRAKRMATVRKLIQQDQPKLNRHVHMQSNYSQDQEQETEREQLIKSNK